MSETAGRRPTDPTAKQRVIPPSRYTGPLEQALCAQCGRPFVRPKGSDHVHCDECTAKNEK